MSLKDEIKELENNIEELKWIHGLEYKFPEIQKDLIH